MKHLITSAMLACFLLILIALAVSAAAWWLLIALGLSRSALGVCRAVASRLAEWMDDGQP